MTDEPYLILHKVRGQPAFDIAIKCEDMGTPEDEGPWWIIPTSGHRAYPVASWNLCDLADVSDYPHEQPWTKDHLVTEHTPDHYAINNAPIKPLTLLQELGLTKPKENLIRRV